MIFFKNIIKNILRTVSFHGYRLIYFKSDRTRTGLKTAVKSDFGFWYAGNIFNSSDLSYGILNNGAVETEETQLVLKILKEIFKKQGRLRFFDIGANTGYYGILAGYMFKDKDIKVFSFEPVKEFFDCLVESVNLNRLENNFKIFNLALSSTRGPARINLSGSGTSLESAFNGRAELEKREVNLETLDNLFAGRKIEAPDFIKIDVEGHELEVLKGGADLISSSRPVIFLEIARKMEVRGYINSNYAATLRVLEKFGYEIYLFKDGVLEPAAAEADLDGVFMYLCLAAARHAGIKKILEI